MINAQLQASGKNFLSFISLIALVIPSIALGSSLNINKKTISIVTGANGYVGREIVHTLLSPQAKDLLHSFHKKNDCAEHDILCLVRASRVEEEKKYWETYLKTKASDCNLKVLPYDMLDEGKSLNDALEMSSTSDNLSNIVLHHVASKFGPTENHTETALENVAGTENTVRVLSKYQNSRMILTSSMAAVRGTGQTPLYHESYYTYQDWNTMSKLGLNWGNSYQWSKCNSEKRAWELSKALGVDMTSICPSFVFGPFPTQSGLTSKSYSIELVSNWIRGESEVQSRLCVDIRDVALAHVKAAFTPKTIGERYIVSAESRLTSKHVANVLKNVCQSNLESGFGDGENIFCDENFDGGAVKIGDKEVDAEKRMKEDLDLVCRDVEETMADMGTSLLKSMCK